MAATRSCGWPWSTSPARRSACRSCSWSRPAGGRGLAVAAGLGRYPHRLLLVPVPRLPAGRPQPGLPGGPRRGAADGGLPGLAGGRRGAELERAAGAGADLRRHPADRLRPARARPGPRPLLLALACGASIGAYTICDGLGIRAAQGTFEYIVWFFFLDGLPFGLGVLWPRRRRLRAALPPILAPAVGGGVLSFLAYGLVIWAMRTTPMAYVSGLRETSVSWRRSSAPASWASRSAASGSPRPASSPVGSGCSSSAG